MRGSPGRRLALRLALLACAAGPGCGSGEPPASPGPMNLLVLLLDTARADHFGYAGHSRPVSPGIDRFASRSVVMLAHYAHASRTGPSVASLFTGLHPRSHGVLNPLDRFDALGTLADSNTTLAEILRGQGYRSAALVANVNVGPRLGFGQGFDDYQLLPGRAKQINAIAGRRLEQLGEPFFLYLHYMEPHTPYRAPEPFSSHFVDPAYRGRIDGSPRQLGRIVRGRRPLGPRDLDQLTALYDQEIRSFDAEFEVLISALERRGLLERTLIVLASDHGEEFLDHGSVLHGYTLYEEQLRVPLLIHDPRLAGPLRIERRTRHVDVLPTLLELLGVSHVGEHQGQSFAALLRGDDGGWEDPYVLAEASLRAAKTVRKRSLLEGDWKLIQTLVPEPGTELYDLASDARETADQSQRREDVLLEMQRRLEQRLAAQPLRKGGEVELGAEEIEQLRELGYLPGETETR